MLLLVLQFVCQVIQGDLLEEFDAMKRSIRERKEATEQELQDLCVLCLCCTVSEVLICRRIVFHTSPRAVIEKICATTLRPANCATCKSGGKCGDAGWWLPLCFTVLNHVVVQVWRPHEGRVRVPLSRLHHVVSRTPGSSGWRSGHSDYADRVPWQNEVFSSTRRWRTACAWVSLPRLAKPP